MDWTTLHWPSGAPAWVLAGVALLLAEALRRRHRGLQERLPPLRAGTLTLLRGLLYAAIVFFLSGPTVLDRQERALPPKLLVLVDASGSMGVKDEPGGRTRLASAVRFLLGPGADEKKAASAEGAPPPSLLDRLVASYEVEVRRFDSVSASLARGELPALEAHGPGSDPLRAIRASLAGGDAAAGPKGNDRPLGILLLTDGGDTTGSDWPPADAGLFPPVVGVGFGSAAEFKDISLHEVRAPRIAFQGKEVRLEVTLSVRGFTGKKLPVALTREGRVIRTQTVDIRTDPTRQTVEFRFTPAEVGSQLLAVETPLQRGEFVESNNRVEIPLEIRRDKIRVLTISGAPSWNYRFLRMALKRDPAIDLVSFVFLRTSEDDPGVPTQELSLVPFPVDKLFLEELKNFEIVVFDNFSAQEYFSNYYLERVGDYVRKGGAFLIFGGRQSFSAGGYFRTPIEDLLPVRLTQEPDYGIRRRITGRLTEAGLRHPITRLSPDPDANAKIWGSFPALRRVNISGPVSEGHVLLSTRGEEGGIPLIATRRVGEGRVLSVHTDDLWRWNFGMVAAEKTNRLYIRLVAQMIRWLSGDPASSQVQILPEAEQGKEGFYVVRVQVLDETYQPARTASVQMTLRDPYGKVRRLPAEFRPETGEFEVRFRPGGQGSYRAQVLAMAGGRAIGQAVRTVAVGGEAGRAEWADASPQWRRIEALAKRTGGLFISSEAAGGGGGGEPPEKKVIEALKGKVPPKVVQVRDVRLWSIPWIGMILILLPAAEWTLRRLWGLA